MTSYAGYGAGYSGPMRSTTPSNNGDLERAVRELAMEPILSVILPAPSELPDTTDNSASWQTTPRVFSTNPYDLIQQNPLGLMLPRIAQRNAEYAQERMENPTITDPVVGLYETTTTEIPISPNGKKSTRLSRNITPPEINTKNKKRKTINDGVTTRSQKMRKDIIDTLLDRQGKNDDTADFIQRL